MMGEHGVPGVGSDPYYIVVAERKGAGVGQVSLALYAEHVAQGDGARTWFHLLTITATMAEDKELCDILSIPFG